MGESLIFDEPYGEYYTSSEVRVDTLDVDEIVFNVVTQENPIFQMTKVPLKCYIVNGKKVDVWGDGKGVWSGIIIIHEDSEKHLDILSKTLLTSAKRRLIKFTTKDSFLNKFAQVKYNHAITIHKSQGSSYQQVITDVGNININSDQQEKNRLLYTAVTRASNLLILYNV